MTSPVCVDSVVHDEQILKGDYILTDYGYDFTQVTRTGDGKKAVQVTPRKMNLQFRTKRRVQRTGVMLVGIGGNNGTTFVAGVISNKHKMQWETREGVKKANYHGSITHAGTTLLGVDSKTHEQVFAPLNGLVPMLNANDLVISGWDISSTPLTQAMKRAKVLPIAVQKQVERYMSSRDVVVSEKPLKSIYYPSFIASNQSERADNTLSGPKHACKEHLAQLRADIRSFKSAHDLDTVIVLWTGNTERYCDVTKGVHDSEESVMRAIVNGHEEISPSQMFAVASLLENCCYINGSPQNTFVPGIVEMAYKRKLFIGGDDFKSGQTKIKSVLVDFLVSSGLKPVSIVSYNHLGNNDGKNLDEEEQFKSKEISKSNVVDDMVKSNNILYNGSKPDHCVVIKYVPTVGDSKRAMDEYISTIFMNGWQTFAIHNTCEDSLLAVPIMIDLITFTELFQRVEWSPDQENWYNFDSILSILSFLLKAPMVPHKTPLINALFSQRLCIDNILRALIGLPPINHLNLEYKLGHKKLLSKL